MSAFLKKFILTLTFSATLAAPLSSPAALLLMAVGGSQQMHRSGLLLLIFFLTGLIILDETTGQMQVKEVDPLTASAAGLTAAETAAFNSSGRHTLAAIINQVSPSTSADSSYETMLLAAQEVSDMAQQEMAPEAFSAYNKLKTGPAGR